MAAAALAVLLGMAVYCLRDNAVPVALLFAWAGISVDVAQYLWHGRSGEAPPAYASGQNRPPSHVIYLLLDEHIGLAGLPDFVPECRCARQAIESALVRGGFHYYPYAYSNYPSTTSSAASFLNRTVLERRRMLLDVSSPEWQWGVHSLSENRLFRHFADRGFPIHLYQHKAINLAARGNPLASRSEYSEMLGALQQAPGPWTDRFQWIVGNYQQSDHVLRRVKGFFPFRFTPRSTGPLGLGTLWPRQLAGDIRRETRPALFFAHLMMPHRPFLYRRDGGVRPLREWSPDRVDRRLTEQAYLDQYRRYCEQAEFLAIQLESLFAALRQAGLYDRALVVLHGDHGSRIRRSWSESNGNGRSSGPIGSDPEIHDYIGAPPMRDLLDRFSTLLAVKASGARRAVENTRTVSLLRFLSEALPLDGQAAPGAASDAAYLFDAAGKPLPITIRPVWERQEEVLTGEEADE